ncbi:hypothetical protein Gotri_000636 [Gossypium trilobum]|uniref:RNase H type-1 domain-containing protein n=1 Tax=Gossypium trilobum TaxID=34281 RepID=A0A7J9FBY7_9ROSI|nr:hypothetical protein [Gossypium trilobum]
MGPACRICGHEYENMLHVLRYCNTARDIRNKLIQIDGSIRAKDAFAATSGILRDQSRRWIIGFNRYLDNCVVLDSKLSGISDGLKLALDGKRVLIQTDSLEAVNIIQVSDHESSNLALVMRIHSLLKLLSH